MRCDPAALWRDIDHASGSLVPVVLIDGGSGSGKTTLARALAGLRPETQVVSLDDCYPGWKGLAEGSRMVWQDILGPLSGYWRWDWAEDRRAGWVRIDRRRPVLVEGCGALTPASRRMATFGIWCELPDDVRRERALARDGDLFAPHWESWAGQEAEHRRAHRPRSLADVECAG